MGVRRERRAAHRRRRQQQAAAAETGPRGAQRAAQLQVPPASGAAEAREMSLERQQQGVDALAQQVRYARRHGVGGCGSARLHRRVSRSSLAVLYLVLCTGPIRFGLRRPDSFRVGIEFLTLLFGSEVTIF